MSNTIPADVQFALNILDSYNESGGDLPELEATKKPFDLDQMIADASGKLGVKVTAGNEVEAEDKGAVTELWTKAEELKKLIDRATKDRAKITAIMKKITPEGKVLTVNGAPVFASLVIASRVVDQDYVKQNHPDDGNSPYYKDQLSIRGDYKR